MTARKVIPNLVALAAAVAAFVFFSGDDSSAIYTDLAAASVVGTAAGGLLRLAGFRTFLFDRVEDRERRHRPSAFDDEESRAT